MVDLFRYSFTSFDGVSPEKPWVGTKNYTELFTRPELFRVFQVSLYYLAASVVQLALALYFATILSFKVRFKNFFKGVLFFPYLINGVAIAFIFLYFFQPGGTLDSVLKLVHIGPQFWLGDEHLNNFSLAGVSVWRYMGLNFVLFLGAIQSVPRELYEAAELDGASASRVPAHHPAEHPADREPQRHPRHLRVAGSVRDPLHHDRRIQRDGDVRHPDGQPSLQVQPGRAGLGDGRGAAGFVLLVTWIQRMLVPDETVDLV